MMKVFPFAFLLLGCSSPKPSPPEQIFPTFSSPEDEWVLYEGKIVTDKGIVANLELSLGQETVGLESTYRMTKTKTEKGQLYLWSTGGKYRVSYGLDSNEQGLTIAEQAMVRRKEKKRDPAYQTVYDNEEMLSTPELFFRTEGVEKLVQTNSHFEALNPRMVLYKRSDLFTVEGYITFEDSLTEFFERNTMKNWKVSQQGEIDSVRIKYIELATELHEGIYLKALAYSVADAATESKKALVIKRSLRIEKSSREKPIP